MRAFIVAAMTVFSVFVHADTSDLRTFLYQAQTDQIDFNLSTEKTKIVWKIVTVRATCYRTVMRRICNGAPRRNVCQNVPVRVAYTCLKRERRAFEEHDYFVNTNVTINFDLNEVDSNVAENFSVNTIGENTKLSVHGSKKVAIFITDEKRTETMEQGTKFVDITFNLKFIPAERINGALLSGIQNVNLDNGILTFTLGENYNTQDFYQNIKVFKSRRLRSDILLMDRNLTSQDMVITSKNGRSNISIDLNQLGVNVPLRSRIIITVAYNQLGYKLLNDQDIKLEASANWILNN